MPLIKTVDVHPPAGPGVVASKVPQITAMFWVVKLLTTAMGEAASDFLLHANKPVGLAIGVAGFALTLVVQFRSRRYNPVAYWAAVSMVAVVGTMAADTLHDEFGVPLAASTAGCAVALVVTFLMWHRTEGTLSIHSITTRRREVFYWLTVSFTFALGTAAGDLTADTIGLGFVGSIVLFAVVMVVPVLGHWRFGLNSIIAFWFAYIVTRPLGASVADWLSKPAQRGGLALGNGPVASVLLAVIAVLVFAIAIRRRARTTAPKGSIS
jgi:uncharacterized membrane-anchored protein